MHAFLHVVVFIVLLTISNSLYPFPHKMTLDNLPANRFSKQFQSTTRRWLHPVVTVLCKGIQRRPLQQNDELPSAARSTLQQSEQKAREHQHHRGALQWASADWHPRVCRTPEQTRLTHVSHSSHRGFPKTRSTATAWRTPKTSWWAGVRNSRCVPVAGVVSGLFGFCRVFFFFFASKCNNTRWRHLSQYHSMKEYCPYWISNEKYDTLTLLSSSDTNTRAVQNLQLLHKSAPTICLQILDLFHWHTSKLPAAAIALSPYIFRVFFCYRYCQETEDHHSSLHVHRPVWHRWENKNCHLHFTSN